MIACYLRLDMVIDCGVASDRVRTVLSVYIVLFLATKGCQPSTVAANESTYYPPAVWLMLPQLSYADCFSILGLSTNATNEQIKVAYKRLALQWHPDRHAENKDYATERFVEVIHFERSTPSGFMALI
ncbi:hypothetical protein PTI98_010280 [Pleurotus ostreatus]|nr:hypothetical protein PTI98_010280 [Pleurotus ostreatus]